MEVPSNHHTLSSGTRIGYVDLFVADLERQIEFYIETIGLRMHWQNEGKAGLGVGKDDLLRLTLREGAVRYTKCTGLYHQAFNVTSKKELARVIARIASKNYPQSPTDHTISWSTYLDDPEGNTVEIYVPTPEEGRWEHTDEQFLVYDNEGNQRSGRDALDVPSLYKTLSPSDDILQPLPKNVFTGHVHLYVNNLDEAMQFYHDILGFERQSLMSRFQMAEVTVEDYPVHLIAFNSWKGKNAPPPPPNATGLNYFSLELKHDAEMEEILKRIIANNLSIENHKDGVLIQDPVANKILLILRDDN